MSAQADKLREQQIDRLAQALLPWVKPNWPGRWGWTELPESGREECRQRAREIINDLQPTIDPNDLEEVELAREEPRRDFR